MSCNPENITPQYFKIAESRTRLADYIQMITIIDYNPNDQNYFIHDRLKPIKKPFLVVVDLDDLFDLDENQQFYNFHTEHWTIGMQSHYFRLNSLED